MVLPRHVLPTLAILLLTALPPPAHGTVIVRVDAAAARRPIDPRIYGLAFASSNALADLNAPLNRSGGNTETRYNWQLNAHNHASDWYFQSLAKEPATPGAAADAHVSATRAAGADAMLTIPMIGWAPKLGPGRQRLASYSIQKYGAQTGNDWQWFPDAGNGIRAANGQPIVTNDPHDANTPVTVAFQSNWVQHLVATWGPATNGGVRYYCLDNEHSIWHETHRDVHPNGATMEQIRDRITTYATMLKHTDPAALTLGPEEFGWSGYLFSGADLQHGNTHGWGGPLPDRTAHGGMDYVPWLLDQLRQRSDTAGRRLLDVLTLHIYPQAGEFSSNTSEAMQLRRNRSTRALWDTNYVDETWIADVVKLIPRMHAWVAQHYPGTAIGITEYNWGAELHMNGATAQADLLGIFGREGLDLATRWTTPPDHSPVYNAIKLYRNYDGAQNTFGDVSTAATAPDADTLAAFAAERTGDGALTIMAVHKALTQPTAATVVISNFSAQSAAEVWQLTASNVIARLPDLPVTSNTLATVLPPQSITLFVVPRLPQPRFTAMVPHATGLDLHLDGTASEPVAIQSSTNLTAWITVATNATTTNHAWITVNTNSPRGFYRAVWQP